MKAFVINKPFQTEIQEIDKPTPQGNEVLIKVAAAGFCGTDVHTYKGEHVTDYPIVPGHEFSGTVVEIGKNITQFKVGDPVLADPNIFCENCDSCKQNHQIHCKNIQVIGNTRNGAFAEYVAVPEQCVFHADGINLIHAAMAEPLACVINAHNKVSIDIGTSVLILGAGTIGLMHLLLAKHRGAATITVTDLKESQLEQARRLGADYAYLSSSELNSTLREQFPHGFDVIIDATGVPKAIEAAVPLLAECGTFVFFGACPTDSEIRVNPFDIYFHDWKFVGSYALQKTMIQSIAMLKNRINLEPLIEKTVPFSDIAEAFDDFVNGKTQNKIIIHFD